MRKLIFLFVLLISGLCFSQGNGAIAGMVLDGELNNTPLTLASVSLEGTSLTSTSDENGYFYFENLESGSYTLVFSFVGYKSKKLEVQVTQNKQTKVATSLIASSISLNDLASLISSTAKKEDKASL
ncbi:MAG TPA: carboxypeptidase-like regulatory domain-containing protein [Flavobacteriaceae bacterium]|nr:carboxypeptidase-like regulatory domain-containing protein [Flavobacteriaceae bacterium]